MSLIKLTVIVLLLGYVTQEISVDNLTLFLPPPFFSTWSSTDTYPSHMGRGHTKARTTQGKHLLVKNSHLPFPSFSIEMYPSQLVGSDQGWFFFCTRDSNLKTYVKMQVLIHGSQC